MIDFSRDELVLIRNALQNKDSGMVREATNLVDMVLSEWDDYDVLVAEEIEGLDPEVS